MNAPDVQLSVGVLSVHSFPSMKLAGSTGQKSSCAVAFGIRVRSSSIGMTYFLNRFSPISLEAYYFLE